MDNHGSKWGWRRVAARFLLAPLLAAGVIAPVAAQSTRTPAQQTRPATSSAEELLRMGRAALKAGQFDNARDYARQALAKKPANGWGYFSDSPESLLKDVAEKKLDMGKAQAEQLTKMAQQLIAQPTRTPTEKMANLDRAYGMADRAVALSGSPDLLDGILSSTPNDVRNEIAKTRTELRRSMATMPTQVKETMDSAVKQVAATEMKPIVPSSATRAQALRLMSEGVALKKQNRIIEARNKAVEAGQLNATFAATEYTPAQLLNDLNADAQDQLTSLLKGTEEYIDRKEYRRAEASLGIAMQVAQGMKLSTEMIESRYKDIQAIKNGKSVELASAEPTAQPMTMPTLQEPKIPSLDAPKLPMVPQVEAPTLPPMPKVEEPKALEVPKLIEPPKLDVPKLDKPIVVEPQAKVAPKSIVMPNEVTAPLDLTPPKPNTLTGEMLLNQAKAELRRGDLEMARKLAMQAYTSDERIKPVAQGLASSSRC